MKVLAAIVVPPHLNVSGAAKAGLQLARATTRHCSVDAAVMSFYGGESEEGGLRTIQARSRNPLGFTRGFLPDRYRTLFYASDIPALVASGEYDLVHLHNPIPALELRRVGRACKRAGIPYVISTHGFVEIASGGDAYGLNPAARLAWRAFIDRPLRQVTDGAARMLALSPADVPILEGMGVPGERIEIVTNGVDPAFLETPPEEVLGDLCRRFDLPPESDPDVPLCAFLGNHTRNKGIDLLLDAFDHTDHPYLLVVGGRQRPQNVDYRKYSGERGRNQRIVFTEMLSDAEARALLHRADLLVFPTRADTLPLVILEAMAASTAVLATRVGGIPFQVDETCGWLAEPDDPRLIRAAYERIYRRRSELREMGVRARARVIERFNWDRSAERAFSIYGEILGNGKTVT